jgi:hypothetical protein
MEDFHGAQDLPSQNLGTFLGDLSDAILRIAHFAVVQQSSYDSRKCHAEE